MSVYSFDNQHTKMQAIYQYKNLKKYFQASRHWLFAQLFHQLNQ